MTIKNINLDCITDRLNNIKEFNEIEFMYNHNEIMVFANYDACCCGSSGGFMKFTSSSKIKAQIEIIEKEFIKLSELLKSGDYYD